MEEGAKMLAQGIEFLILGIVLVWSFSELSARLRARTERRRAAGRHLAQLLDVRHRLLSFRRITEELSNTPESLPEELASLGATLKGILPEHEGLRKELENSTAFLAESEPFFAFRLRMKQFQFPAVGRLASLASADGRVDAGWMKIEKQFIRHTLRGLDEMILVLARRHNWKTWLAVRDYLQRPLELSIEMKKVLSDLGAQPHVEAREPKAA